MGGKIVICGYSSEIPDNTPCYELFPESDNWIEHRSLPVAEVYGFRGTIVPELFSDDVTETWVVSGGSQRGNSMITLDPGRWQLQYVT